MKTILIVEDEPDEARAMQLVLENAGFSTRVVGDVSSAMREIRGNLISLIVLDIILPVNLGNKLLEEMRDKKIEVPVVVVTAVSNKLTHIEKDLRVINPKIGFIQKPFTSEQLVSEVKRKAK